MAKGGNPYHAGAGVKGAGGVNKGGTAGNGGTAGGGRPSSQMLGNQGRGPRSIPIATGGSHFRGASVGKSTGTTTNSGGHTDGVSRKIANSSMSQTSSKGGHSVVSKDDKSHGC